MIGRDSLRPLERSDVTICIAAICDGGTDDRKIVYCTDQLVASLFGSSDNNMKFRFMYGGWSSAVAGESSAVKATHTLIARKFMRVKGAPAVDETDATRLVREALAARKKELAEEYTQTRWAVPYSEFLEHGKSRFPEDEFRKAISEISRISLDAEFIIAGAPHTIPFLIETRANGEVATPDQYAIIGKGAHLAQSVMMHRAHSDVDSLSRTLYTTFEAKKFAERERSVGTATCVFVHHQDGRVRQMANSGYNWLKEQYKKFGPQDLPRDDVAIPEGAFNPREFKA